MLWYGLLTGPAPSEVDVSWVHLWQGFHHPEWCLVLWHTTVGDLLFRWDACGYKSYLLFLSCYNQNFFKLCWHNDILTCEFASNRSLSIPWPLHRWGVLPPAEKRNKDASSRIQHTRNVCHLFFFIYFLLFLFFTCNHNFGAIGTKSWENSTYISFQLFNFFNHIICHTFLDICFAC